MKNQRRDSRLQRGSLSAALFAEMGGKQCRINHAAL
jgi:hypothetical protein